MAYRPKGWLPSEREAGEYTERHVLGSAPATATRTRLTGPDMVRFRGPRIYQTGESCVANFIKRAICMSREMQLGPYQIDNPLVSASYIYAMARFQENVYDRKVLAELEDRGCYPYLAVRACRNMGFVLDKHYRDGYVDVTAPPPRALDRFAFDARGMEFARIYETGKARTSAIEQCMMQGWPVGFGMPVDQAFEDLVGIETYPGVSGAVLGYHMVCVLLVDSRERKLLVDNWWRGWGHDGMGWISLDFIESPEVRNVFAIRKVPAVQSRPS